jgi:hypothetical protein
MVSLNWVRMYSKGQRVCNEYYPRTEDKSPLAINTTVSLLLSSKQVNTISNAERVDIIP